MRVQTSSKLSKLIYCDDFEARELRFMTRFLRSGDVFADVGANVGLFTLVAARCVGRTGSVHAFEPCAATHARLQANVLRNQLSCVECHRFALGDAVNVAEMATSMDGLDAWNSLARPAGPAPVAIEHVDCTTWDKFAGERHLVGNVAMMKIDVEGWESRVIAGAQRTLSRPDAPVLQVEFTDSAAEAASSSCNALYEALISLGYRMFSYDESTATLKPEPPRASYPWLNLIAAKHPEAVNARLRRWRLWPQPK